MKKLYIILNFILLISTSGLFCVTSSAAIMTPDSPSDWGKYAIIDKTFIVSGNITRLTLAGLDAAVKDGITTVEINSKGGDLDTGYIMAKIIRDNGLDTFVAKGGECMSAALTLFLAGRRRFAHPDSIFMVHGVKFYLVGQPGVRQEMLKEEQLETRKLKESYRNEGVSETLIGKISSKSDDIYFSGTEALYYGVVMQLNTQKETVGNNLKFDWSRKEVDEVEKVSARYGLQEFLISPMSGDEYLD